MNRIPPCLLYLAIYNPTLTPAGDRGDDIDEDVEEQAHILFYTSKERAVSRDRMLRQIGLSKALVNFSELFDPLNLCESIHSQTRRMIMVSPEPNFWINATIELPKLPQPRSAKSGSKGKEKESTERSSTTYDYEEGAVHDLAIQTALLQGYAKFKMLHGSFSTILSELGQEALELQLERFFTVWAWSWDLEAKPELLNTLGTPLHPYFSILIPLLDGYCSLLPEHVVPVMFLAPHIIPSSRYTAHHFPSVLSQYLLSIIPPPSPPAEENLSASIDTIKALKPDAKSSNTTGPSGLFNVNMPDVTKWNWQGYLTFGKKSSSSKPPLPAASTLDGKQGENSVGGGEREEVKSEVDEPSEAANVQAEVDPQALEDALSSEGIAPNVDVNNLDNASSVTSDGRVSNTDSEDALPVDRLNAPDYAGVSSSPKSSLTISPGLQMGVGPKTPPPPPPPPEFSFLRLHLAPSPESPATKRRTVHYHIRDGLMLALIGLDETSDAFGTSEDDILSLAAEHAIELFDTVELNIQKASESKLAESLPSAAKILQPSDQFAIATGQYAVTNPGFSSTTSHLFNAKALLRKDSHILEVFSRGQNPPHWHISKRGLSAHTGDSPTDEESTSLGGGEMHLEVFKKEASLPDVDNILASILRKSGVVEGGLV